MSQADAQSAAEASPEMQLEGGTYEIIRGRLAAHGEELRRRLERLNAERKEVFGSIDLALKGTERITTEHNCVPRDMLAIGRRVLFGYNVHFGLKRERHLEDVFAAYEFRDGGFHEVSLDLIRHPEFEKHFQDVYRYYRDAVFAKFFASGPHLYMVFRVGRSVNDIKTFKWAVRGGELAYVDNRSDHEVQYPPQHEFEWKRTHRDQHRSGLHPHISIDDRVFVETVGGDLTIKVENNTDSGEGIYAEPVDNKDQSLDDAEIHYSILGNVILLKIRPYQEPQFRHIVYNEKLQQARRLDAIAHACVLLPGDHGLIFPNGYYLQHGECKVFETDPQGMVFRQRIASPNGEDYLYVFYNRDAGVYVLLQYNVIAQRVETPIVCHGYTLFEGGELVCFKCHEQPQKHHAVQIWQTPFVGEDFVPHTESDSYLFKIGNRDIVRAMAECHEVLTLIDREDTYADLYVDLVKEAGDVLDSYFWIDRPEAHNLAEPLAQIKAAAATAISEYEKVVRVRQSTAEQTKRVQGDTRNILAAVNRQRFDDVHEYVESLAELRRVRGEVIALRDLRYADLPLVDELEQSVAEESDRLARRCVDFLLRPDALDPYVQRVEAEQARIPELAKVADAKEVEEQIGRSAAELEMLIDIVGNLRIDDATQRTAIIDSISAIFSNVNQARAALRNKTKELLSVEGIAEFNAQLKLLNQAVVNYLDVCDTPQRCEEYLTRIMIQVEELEGRFAEFDEFVLQLGEKREEVYNAFEARKVQLVEARNRRANSLAAAADRILKGIKTRVDSFESIEDIHGYFASDLMIERVREIVRQLEDLEDSVKVDDVQSRLKTIREDAVRQLKDRQELFVGGDNVIRFGRHLFNVNVQALDLTTVLRDGELQLHLTGTNFFETIDDERLARCRDVWDQEVVSENRDVYRAEYLAWLIRNEGALDEIRTWSDEALAAWVQKFMGPRYSEGYLKGVHDHDAARIARSLAEIEATIGLLRFSAPARALGRLYWQHFGNKRQKAHLAARLAGFGAVARAFPDAAAQAGYVADLCGMLREFLAERPLFPEGLVEEAAEYLFAELTGEARFVVSRAAAGLIEDFQRHLDHVGHAREFAESIKGVQSDTAAAFLLLRDWLRGYVSAAGSLREPEPERPALESEATPESQGKLKIESGDESPHSQEHLDEAAVLLLEGRIDTAAIVDATVACDVEGLVGNHPRIDGGRYRLHYNHFTRRLARFTREVVPRFLEFGAAKKEIIARARETMKLEEFRPHVLTSFVRSRLIDAVYLPMVGDNLAKQIGAAGETKRTDRSGLLLLISPPGYGKTTLMEYIANRLGLIFMKINGPAIGHQVTSLDPSEAPNAAAREEMHKLALALEMGDNVMLYLDDIQHCHPEFLQKFISLCDAQRKIEGVYKGRTRTYDFRGRKVAVVMAGNPYTESGEKFQIPDMLANRADVYNLGEIIGGHAEAFEMSFLENALTSNPVLSRLAARSQKDVYAVIRMAERGDREGIELEGNYSAEELGELAATMQKLIRVRDIVLRINREYIRSAAQSDDYRTEPAFKLQGSYRNMNRIAERVVPLMNDDELMTAVVSAYENDAQTLTTGAESNLLKFKELLGILTEEEAQRWEDIKRTFQRNVRLRGIDTSDRFGQAVAQLSAFGDGLDAIRGALSEGVARLAERNGKSEEAAALETGLGALLEQAQGVRAGLEAIGSALAGTLARLPEQGQDVSPMADAAEQASRLLGTSETLVLRFTEALRELGDQLRALAESRPRPERPRVEVVPAADDEGNGHGGPASAPSASNVPATITVVNKLPRTVMNVLEQQFQLMQGWLKPLLAASEMQRGELRELRERLESCLDDYSRLVGRLQEARHPSDGA